MAKWVKCKNSKKSVMRAGEFLIGQLTPDLLDEYIESMNVLSNWRASHAYPMHALLMLLRKKAIAVDKRAVVVQRLKRTPSIISKLSRYPEMKLHRMQDISGCRAIVSTVKEVEKLSAAITKSRTRHRLHKSNNYIEEPKPSGYRGIHLIYKYNGDKEDYKDFFVELQIRSKIQHAWATAVEIVDTFTDQALKSSNGKKDWLDFFTFASAEFAKIERRPIGSNVEGIDTHSELTTLTEKLKVSALLKAFTVTANHITNNSGGENDYFLLELKNNAKEMKITQYKSNDLTAATQSYLEKEKLAKDNSADNVVLVAAGSMHALRRAYPNYFADSRDFLRYLDRALIPQPDLFKQ